MEDNKMLFTTLGMNKGSSETPLDRKDHILQKACPTVMTPLYSPLPEIEPGSYRFLMARDGLWIEAHPPWGHFRFPLWSSPRPLPYGDVESETTLFSGPVSSELIDLCRKEATLQARVSLEWAGWIIWSEESGYQYLPLEIIEATKVSIKYKYPVLPEGTYLAMNLHSHPFKMSKFSETDDHDDQGGMYYSGVFSFDSGMNSKLTLRLCLEGFFFE
jgi:PRTRC genetic system protein A